MRLAIAFLLIVASSILATTGLPTAQAQLSYDDVVAGITKNDEDERREDSTNSYGYNGQYGGVYAAPLAMDPPPRSSGLSARDPDAAWESVKRASPSGYRQKSMSELDEYAISEDDMLDVTGRSTARSDPARRKQEPMGELCCPAGTDYYFGICQGTAANPGIFTPGTRYPPSQACIGSRPAD